MIEEKYINPFTNITKIDYNQFKNIKELKYYRDIKNVVDTSFEEGKKI